VTTFEVMAQLTLLDIAELGFQCSQIVADDFRCAGIATHRVHWPSGDTRCCDHHVRHWKAIGEAMGIHNLQMTPLPVRRNDPGPDDAAERFALMELT
jgi:hypothetical protein